MGLVEVVVVGVQDKERGWQKRALLAAFPLAVSTSSSGLACGRAWV